MLFFQLFQYCLGSVLGIIGDFFSEQLLYDPQYFLLGTLEPCTKRYINNELLLLFF